MVKVLFVCLGNICRSPLAEGIFSQMIKEQGLKDRISCDSCGTAAYHVGSQPDSRSVANAKENGLILNHQSRQFDGSDFEEFDHILLMDQSNLYNVIAFDEYKAHASKVELMRTYDVENLNADVPDPYFGGDSGFQEVYEILYRSCGELLTKIEENL